MMTKMCGVHKVAWILVIVGALNWGLVGFFQFDLVAYLFGSWPMVERVIYALVGLAAVSIFFMGSCGPCKKEMGSCCKDGEKKV